MSQLHDLLPDFLSCVYEIDEILKAEETELDLLFQERYAVLDNVFVGTAEEFGIKKYEKIYGIVPSSSQSLEERRFVIKAMMKRKTPSTLNYLKDYLKNLCGESGYTLELDRQNYSLEISLVLPSQSAENSVRKFISNLIPANIVLDLQVDYSQAQEMQYQTGG